MELELEVEDVLSRESLAVGGWPGGRRGWGGPRAGPEADRDTRQTGRGVRLCWACPSRPGWSTLPQPSPSPSALSLSLSTLPLPLPLIFWPHISRAWVAALRATCCALPCAAGAAGAALPGHGLGGRRHPPGPALHVLGAWPAAAAGGQPQHAASALCSVRNLRLCSCGC